MSREDEMATKTKPTPKPRVPLSRDRVLDGAVTLADDAGIDAVTMRRLASELGVEAMSLYYHVANKEELLDGMIERIVGEIEEDCGEFTVSEDIDWKTALRKRILTARAVMLRHRWAPGVFETRTNMSPPMVRYFETLLGTMIQGGFSYELGHNAMHALGSRALGFNQELFVPDNESQEAKNDEVFAQMADQLPYLVGMMQAIAHDDPESSLGWCDDQTEFEFGLDLILNGLEHLMDKN